MTPDAANHNPDPDYIQDLIKQTGLSQKEIARRLGVSDRMMRYYTNPGNINHPCPYTVQYCLEMMSKQGERKWTKKN